MSFPDIRTRHGAVRLTHSLAFVVLVLLLAACGGGGRAGYIAKQQTVDGLTITLEHPQQLTVLDDYELFVTLTGADGQPIDGATVFMEQDMPSMPMRSNQPLGEPLGKGQYRLAGVFTMEGAWHLMIHATVAGQAHVAAFEQTVTVK